MRINFSFYFILLFFVVTGCEDANTNDTMQIGQGGSMARFAIDGNYLYAVSDKSLIAYSIANGTFEKKSTTAIAWGVETLFVRYPYLYIGSNEAMYIFSITDPEQPGFVFQYAHIRSCDPVVVQGNRAYVTMRNGNSCNPGNNSLEILDISSPENTTLIANYGMESPHGLAVHNNLLFLCEGANGFKVFDISDEMNIQLLKHDRTFDAYDVIVLDNWIAVTGEDGIFQFQFPDQENVIKLVSKIPVLRN